MNNDYPSLKVSFHEQTNRSIAIGPGSISIAVCSRRTIDRYTNSTATVLLQVQQQAGRTIQYSTTYCTTANRLVPLILTNQPSNLQQWRVQSNINIAPWFFPIKIKSIEVKFTSQQVQIYFQTSSQLQEYLQATYTDISILYFSHIQISWEIWMVNLYFIQQFTNSDI